MADSPTAAPKGKNSRARVGLTIFGVLALALGGIALTRWWLHGRFVESTDDAYLQADQVAIAPRVAGYIDTLYVRANQAVKAGDPLARIDARNYQAVLSQQQASLDARLADISAADSQIEQQRANIGQYEAQLTGAKANLEFARTEALRFQNLFQQGVETQERAEQAQNQLAQYQSTEQAAAASLLVAQHQLATLANQRKQAQAQLEAARAAVNSAQLDVSDTVLRASINGRIGDDTARLGQYVQPGSRLMSIVPVQAVYLVANFKETQLRRMHLGQHATIKIDALDQTIDGQIDSFSPGTGAQFALLPPENATGNFIKIVQRVPVRFRVLPPQDLADRLLPGLSVTVSVDTDQTGN